MINALVARSSFNMHLANGLLTNVEKADGRSIYRLYERLLADGREFTVRHLDAKNTFDAVPVVVRQLKATFPGFIGEKRGDFAVAFNL